MAKRSSWARADPSARSDSAGLPFSSGCTCPSAAVLYAVSGMGGFLDIEIKHNKWSALSAKTAVYAIIYTIRL